VPVLNPTKRSVTVREGLTYAKSTHTEAREGQIVMFFSNNMIIFDYLFILIRETLT
jgi:hypothetical protein